MILITGPTFGGTAVTFFNSQPDGDGSGRPAQHQHFAKADADVGSEALRTLSPGTRSGSLVLERYRLVMRFLGSGAAARSSPTYLPVRRGARFNHAYTMNPSKV
jgi:hypothetical protein